MGLHQTISSQQNILRVHQLSGKGTHIRAIPGDIWQMVTELLLRVTLAEA